MKTKVVVSVTILFLIAGCAYESTSSSCWWVQSYILVDVWGYLEQEHVRMIAFAKRPDFPDAPENLIEITCPVRIQQIMLILHEALLVAVAEQEKFLEAEEKQRNQEIIGTFDIFVSLSGPQAKYMKIVTDKHKYAIHVNWTKEVVYGMEWRSYELRERLREWGLP